MIPAIQTTQPATGTQALTPIAPQSNNAMNTSTSLPVSPATPTPKPGLLHGGGVLYAITGDLRLSKDDAPAIVPNLLTGFNLSPPPRQAIALSVLQPALGFNGPSAEFRQRVVDATSECFHDSQTTVRGGVGAGSKTFRCPVIPLEDAEKVALALGSSQAACVAYLLSEIRYTGDAIEIFSPEQLQLMGNPYCHIHQPRDPETSGMALHRFLRIGMDADLWWRKKRVDLNWEPGDDPRDRLRLPYAIQAMATECHNYRGGLARLQLTEGLRINIYSRARRFMKSWYLFLREIVLDDIRRKTILDNHFGAANRIGK
jgi:hypothetical protein